MSAFTLVYTRALDVIPSDDVNIPYPNPVLQNSTTSVVSWQLVDNTVNFETKGIKVGDTVLNATTQIYATVIAVFPTYLILSQDIFTSIGESYIIYQGVNNGCYIYVPQVDYTTTSALVEVETIGGDNVVFFNPPAGVLPVQVLKVKTGTDLGKLVALW